MTPFLGVISVYNDLILLNSVEQKSERYKVLKCYTQYKGYYILYFIYLKYDDACDIFSI